MKNATSITSKILLALTGLFLSIFLIVHLVGNLQLLKSDGGYAFNKYAVLMTTNPLIATVSWLLYATILFHAFKGLYLVFKNKQARGVGYKKSAANTNSTWYSRSMGLLGTIILLFIVLHMNDFWFKYKFGYTPYAQYNQDLVSGEIKKTDIPDQAGKPPILAQKMEEVLVNNNRIVVIKDLYTIVKTAFGELWIVVLYVVAMIALGFHLLHGFQSAFQTLGIGNKTIRYWAKVLGIWIFGILIPFAFAVVPMYMFLSAHGI